MGFGNQERCRSLYKKPMEKRLEGFESLGKMLGSFGSQIGFQNATDIGRNVPWASQADRAGRARKKFWLGLPRSTLQYESHLLGMNAEHPQIS